MTKRFATTTTSSNATASSVFLRLLSIIIVAVTAAAAFTARSPLCHHRRVFQRNHHDYVVPRGAYNNFLPLIAAATTISELDTKNNNAIYAAKEQINQVISSTDKGRSVPSEQKRSQITSCLSNLEALCPLIEPARSPLMDGPWIVLYTDAPPPSNGQLAL